MSRLGAGLRDTGLHRAGGLRAARRAAAARRRVGRHDRRAPARGLGATDTALRARRADTLALARNADPLPINEAIMVAWARLMADCCAGGLQRAVRLTDALIAATAVEHGLPVVTQDDDFDAIARAHPALTVARV